MTRKQRHLLTRIIVAAVLFLAGSLLHLPELAEMAVFLVCYVVVGWDIVWKAITNILHGQVFDENFLMTIATIGALILGEHSEGVAVMLFYQVGEWFQSYAVSKSRKSIASLMDIRPDYANIERDGKLVQVDPDEVQIGETTAQFALSWMLSRKPWIAPVPGTTNPAHLDDFLGGSSVRLSEPELKEFDLACSRIPLMGHRADPFTESQIDK